MFGMGMGEIVLIAVVALLALGPERLPEAAKAIGKGIRDLRQQSKELQHTIENDTQIGDAVRELRGALRGDPESLYRRATGEDFSAPAAPDQPAEADKGKDEGETSEESDASVARSPQSGDAEPGDEAAESLAGDDESAAQAEASADPDLPLLRTPAGTLARSEEPPEDELEDESSRG